MLSENYRTRLLHLANQFRHAIDIAKNNGEFIYNAPFGKFPCGCCGDTCCLLGQYLLEHGIESTYVCGTYYYENPEGGCQSHAWILAENFIVDITGDQFKYHEEFWNYNVPVYVGNGNKFHNLFDVEDRDVHPSFSLSQYSSRHLNELYQKIVCYLSNGNTNIL